MTFLRQTPTTSTANVASKRTGSVSPFVALGHSASGATIPGKTATGVNRKIGANAHQRDDQPDLGV